MAKTLKSVSNLAATGKDLAEGTFREAGGARGTIRDQFIATGERTEAEVRERSAEAGATAQGQFDVVGGIVERQNRAQTGGAGRDPRQQAASKRKLGLARALADVNARNLNIRGQRQEILSARTGAAGLRGILDSQLLSGQDTLGTEETQRNVDFQRDLAAFKKRKAGGIGAIAGLAATFIPVVGPVVAPLIKDAVTGAVA